MSYLPPSGSPPPGGPSPHGSPPLDDPYLEPPPSPGAPSTRWPEPPRSPHPPAAPPPQAPGYQQPPDYQPGQTEDWGLPPPGSQPRYGNFQFGPEPEPAGSGRSARDWALIAVIALVVVGGLGAAAFLFLRGDGGGGEEEPEEASPESTVVALFNAAKTGDCETVADLATENYLDVSSREEALTACQGFVDNQVPGWVDDYTVGNVVLESEAASTATVSVSLNPGPGSQAPPGWTIELVREADDTWRVDAAEIATSSEGPSAPQDSENPDAPSAPETDAPDLPDDPGVNPGVAGQPSPPPTGAGSDLDSLAQSCHDGDMTACDMLFEETYDENHPDQSEHPEHTQYGYSCGGRLNGDIDELCQAAIPDPAVS